MTNKEDKKNKLNLLNGDILTLKDFSKQKIGLEVFKLLLNVGGMADLLTGGKNVKNVEMGGLMELFPHFVISVTSKGNTFVPNLQYLDTLDFKDLTLVFNVLLNKILFFIIEEKSEKS